ncbi:MAG TPA: orotidine-5'-phosphate decarboxylase [Acidimicrobiales bacterium]
MRSTTSPTSITDSRARSAEGPGARPVRLAIALDLDDQVAALALANEVQPYFAIAKVGLELFSASGPEIVTKLREAGVSVFVDLKLHDIPTTVERAARALGSLGAEFATVHASGGVDMVRAAVTGFGEGAAAAGLQAPTVLGVTVLTSDTDAPPELLLRRVEVLLAAGAGGLVCAADDLLVIRQAAPDLVAVVPGIRPSGAGTDDQARAATPAAAVANGADVLVIGRPVSRAADPRGAARAIADELGIS